MPPNTCTQPTSFNHLHASFNRRNPYPNLVIRQKEANAQNSILAYNAVAQLKRFKWYVPVSVLRPINLYAFDRPKMTDGGLGDRHLGSTLPDGARVPLRLLEVEFERMRTWIYCYCLAKLPEKSDPSGCTVQIMTTSENNKDGVRYILTCHNWPADANNNSFPCGLYGKLYSILLRSNLTQFFDSSGSRVDLLAARRI